MEITDLSLALFIVYLVWREWRNEKEIKKLRVDVVDLRAVIFQNLENGRLESYQDSFKNRYRVEGLE